MTWLDDSEEEEKEEKEVKEEKEEVEEMEEEDSRKRKQQPKRPKGRHTAGLVKKLHAQCVQSTKSEGACGGRVGTEAI